MKTTLQAAIARSLGYQPRIELYLCPFESGYQGTESQYDLHCRSRTCLRSVTGPGLSLIHQ